jgi:adenosine deaminase
LEKRRTPHRHNKYYEELPKVDLHRHLEGSVRLSTLIDVAHIYGVTIPGTGELRSLVQVTKEEPYTFKNFLSKFQTLRLFYRSQEIIRRITREAIADAAADNVRYLELRFTPVALGKEQDFSLSDVMDWVIEGVHQAQEETGILTRLIVSVNRHESPQLAEEVVRLAIEHHTDGIAGLDLAGNEANFSALPFANIFIEAQQAGLHISVHAGEWGGASNIAEAITCLGAERIGHGVRVLEDPAVVDLARERNATFEVCITSNYQSGSIASIDNHPLPRMLAAGLNVTINTDDPSISQITLSDEYRLACEGLGISFATLQGRVLAAAKAAFLPEPERQALVTKLQEQLWSQ